MWQKFRSSSAFILKLCSNTIDNVLKVKSTTKYVPVYTLSYSASHIPGEAVQVLYQQHAFIIYVCVPIFGQVWEFPKVYNWADYARLCSKGHLTNLRGLTKSLLPLDTSFS